MCNVEGPRRGSLPVDLNSDTLARLYARFRVQIYHR
ncbi:hypothetical protein ACVIJW_009902 [Bradyrhizobium barranii subsp. barranii]